MKKLLLIAGILLIVICVVCLLFAALNLHGYYNVLDGSPELYQRLHQRAVVSGLLGAVLGAAGAACLIFRSRL